MCKANCSTLQCECKAFKMRDTKVTKKLWKGVYLVWGLIQECFNNLLALLGWNVSDDCFFLLFFVTKNAESLFFSKSDPFHRWRHWYLLNTIRVGSTFSIRIKDVGSVFCCCYLHCCCLCSSRPHCLCGWWRSRRDSWTSGRESRLLRRDHARRNRNSLHFRFPTNIPFRPDRYCFELSSCKKEAKRFQKNIPCGLGIRTKGGGSWYTYGSRYPYKEGIGNCTSAVSSTDTEAVSVLVQKGSLNPYCSLSDSCKGVPVTVRIPGPQYIKYEIWLFSSMAWTSKVSSEDIILYSCQASNNYCCFIKIQ